MGQRKKYQPAVLACFCGGEGRGGGGEESGRGRGRGEEEGEGGRRGEEARRRNKVATETGWGEGTTESPKSVLGPLHNNGRHDERECYWEVITFVALA